uniref:non-specific serine/threonine protein kinase n=1 Tax=Zooxanthella nutricula TaxID=1333877 RepID=A0A7S2KG90_9DINO
MEVLGSGSFGVVSRVEQQDTGKIFALKSIPVGKVKDPSVFQRELGIARRLKHPYIVTLHHTFQDREAYHLVMDFCEGGDFLKRMRATLRDRGPGRQAMGGLSTSETVQYLGQMLKGIAYLHNYQLAHRDVKPENYLLVGSEPSADLRLIDFGLARYFEAGKRMYSKVGSVSYVAPEVVTGSDGYDAKCDIWSVGATACVMAVARKPFAGDNVSEYIRTINRAGGMVFDYHWARHPQCLKDVIAKLMAKSPANRPGAAELLQTAEWKHLEAASGNGCNGCCTVQ